MSMAPDMSSKFCLPHLVLRRLEQLRKELFPRLQALWRVIAQTVVGVMNGPLKFLTARKI